MTADRTNEPSPRVARSRIRSDVDYNSDRYQVGHLFLEHSVNRSAYSRIRIPVSCTRNCDEPTILLAGNHGDECEGLEALRCLVRRLAGELVRGRVI